jgi:geranylgeranyl diphosphate synthase type II
MVHTYSLIHDDLPAMDDDDLRRGRPTSHKRFGEALAILAGDALLTLAFDVLARESASPGIAAASCADLACAAGASGMVGGQVVDLECEGRFGGREVGAADAPGDDLALLESLHLRKTGRLLQCSLTLGARAAGAAPGQLAALEEYGKRVGLAFQIADDLLDVTGERDRTGKAVGKDADSGKLTYPGLLGVQESRRKALDLVGSACGHLGIFGEKGRRLESLAHFVLERDH